MSSLLHDGPPGPPLPAPIPGEWAALPKGQPITAGASVELWCLDVPGGEEWLRRAIASWDRWLREHGYTFAEGGSLGPEEWDGRPVLMMRTTLVPWPGARATRRDFTPA